MSVRKLHPEAPPTQKFASLAAHLYPCINVENGVRTKDGPGTLRQAFSDVCFVEPLQGPLTGSYGSGKQTFRLMREYDTVDVRPA